MLAGGTTAVIYYVGIAAETWLKRFSWVGLLVAVLFGIGTALFMKRRTAKMAERVETESAQEPDPVSELA